MNTASNLEITDEESEGNQRVFYISKKNPKLPWPSNATIVEFAVGGDYKKFRFLTTGDPNLKVLQVK